MELVHSVLLAKHLGVEKLKAIRQYYKDHRLSIPELNRNAFEMLLKQHGKHITKDSSMCTMFRSGGIPILPYRMQMVALWEEVSNWRVLQASAHQDIFYSLSCPSFGIPIFERPRPASLFDFCAELASNEQVGICQSNYFLGVLTESVRTSLAEWVAAGMGDRNWDPKVSTARFNFTVTVPEKVCDTLKNRYSLFWVCQNALQREVARGRNFEDLAANRELIILFLLEFQLWIWKTNLKAPFYHCQLWIPRPISM